MEEVGGGDAVVKGRGSGQGAEQFGTGQGREARGERRRVQQGR